jgi:hypothetical protein
MINPNCIEEKLDSKIKCRDGNRYVIIKNDENDPFLKIRVDNCVVTDGARADWVVEKAQSALIIELKGRDVEHAATQIFETAALWKIQEKRCVKVAGLIIARQYPRASTSLQRKQDKFAKEFKGPLHVINHNAEVVFSRAMSFKNPLKA